MAALELFGWGMLGGIAGEVLGAFRLRHQVPEQFPGWLKSWFYWIVAIVMVLLGGGVVVAYVRSGFTITPILAIHLGASAPTLFGSFVSQAPRIDPGRID